ncbi:MAG: hypothetical protein V7731_11055 [Amphritea sp.]
MNSLQSTTQTQPAKPKTNHTLATDYSASNSTLYDNKATHRLANIENERGQIWHCSEYDF